MKKNELPVEVSFQVVHHNPFAGGEIDSAVPTTASQKEMWSTLQMEPNATLCYNESIRVSLNGSLDLTLLAQAFQEVQTRHDSLRATFSRDGKKFIVGTNPNSQLKFLDLSDSENQLAEIQNLIKSETEYKFDLFNGPVIVARIAQLNPEHHILFITAHHIICDGWSLAVIVNELSLIYTALKNKNTYKEKWPVQFYDYSMKQFQEGLNEKDKQYWIDIFSGSIPTMDLPLDYERPKLRTYESIRVDKLIPKELVTAYKKFGAKLGASYYVSLMAVFEVLLHKLLKQDDLVVGISSAAQSSGGHESLVGHLVNLLPIRQKVSEKSKFVDFIKDLKSTMLDAMDHQDFTYGSLLNELKLERDPSRIPLVNIIFNVDQQYPGQGLEFEGLAAHYESNPRHFENFEIFINATACEDRLVLECQYNKNLFNESSINNWLDNFQKIIETVLKNPSVEISQIDLDLKTNSISSSTDLGPKNIIEVKNSPEEIAIGQIWEKVLGFSGIPHDANFFSIGGHSLLGTEVINLINKEFSLNLTLKDIFEAPTICELALKVNSNESIAPSSISGLEPGLGNHSAFPPVSINQIRAWYLEQLSPGTMMHNLPASIKIQGRVDRQILEKSLNIFIARHPATRTQIVTKSGKPVQEILPDLKLKLEEQTLESAEVLEEMQKESNFCFDLESAPLLKAKLYKISEDEFVFYFMVHHIIWDGWCFDIFFKEIDQIYSSLIKGEDPELELLPDVTYADFSVWQNNLGQKGDFGSQTEFWKESLKLPLPVLELPTDKKRPLIMNNDGLSVPFVLGEELKSSLKKLAIECQTSLFNILLTAFKINLSYYSQTNDVIVGSPVRGRNQEDLDKIIGYFVNTVALRTHIDLNKSFFQNIEAVKKTCLSAFGNQDIPFEKVLENIDYERDQSRSPIYQAFFSYQDVSNRKAELGGHAYSQINIDKASTHTDLDLWVKNSDKKLEGAFEFRVDLFEENTIKKFKDGFIQILESLCSNKEKETVNAELIAPSVKEELLVGLNNTTVDNYQYENFIHLFIEQAKKNPNSVAIIGNSNANSKEYTYKELDKVSSSWALKLQEQGVKKGDLVGLSSIRNNEMLVSLIAILKAGAGYVPLDPGFPQDRLDYMVESSGIKVLLVSSEVANRFQQKVTKLIIEDLSKSEISEKIEDISPEYIGDGSDTAYVIYTSGSTGLPKGVELPHKAVLNFLVSMGKNPGFNSKDSLLAVTTLSFDIAVLELYLPLISGGSVLIATKEQAMDGHALKGLIEKFNINTMQATPSTWRLLLASGWTENKSFKALCGGEPFPKDLAQKLCSNLGEVWNMYGPTETTVWSTCKKLNGTEESILIGKPIDNTTIYILDDDKNLTPPGGSGNLFIGGDGLAKGYFGREDLTSERFIANPFVPGERIYDTGDLARYHSNGEIECLGRNDGQVKVRGYRIELSEIEIVISKFSGIEECVVITREDRPGDVRIVAYLIGDNNLNQMNLRMHIGEKLPPYMIPSHFVFMEEFPKTLNQKIDKKNLPAPVINHESSPDLVSNDAEAKVKTNTYSEIETIWKNLLNLSSVNPKDNFFDIGGHSLVAVELFSKLSERFGVNLSLALLLEAPTLEDFVNKVQLAMGEAVDTSIESSDANFSKNIQIPTLATSLVSIKNTGNAIPLFCFHGAGGNVLNYIKLASFIGKDHPIFGLQAQGVDGESDLHSSIDEMAEHYISEIKSIRPEGPYLLAGGSMGGLLALEVATRLKERGDSIQDIIMFDTFGPDIDLKNFGYEKLSFFSRVKASLVYRFEALLNKTRVAVFNALGAPIPHKLRFYYIELNNYKLIRNHTVKNYCGGITLIRCKQTDNGYYADPKMGWSKVIAGEVKTLEINGNHDAFVEAPEFGPAFASLFK